jgi:hypothetical protein
MRKVAAVFAWSQCSAGGAVSVPIVAKRTVGVVIAGFEQRLLGLGLQKEKSQWSTYQLRQACHHRRTREDWRWKVTTASAPLQAGRAATVAVVVGTGSRLAVDVRCTKWAQRMSTRGTLEVAVVGSRPPALGAGTPRVLVRCRVPYWQDALP